METTKRNVGGTLLLIGAALVAYVVLVGLSCWLVESEQSLAISEHTPIFVMVTGFWLMLEAWLIILDGEGI